MSAPTRTAVNYVRRAGPAARYAQLRARDKIYPSLLRGVAITEPNHDRASDITLEEAAERYRKPRIFNTDQGAHSRVPRSPAS
jgi:hypothetical protein